MIRCVVCNRKLKAEKSIKMGMGYVCHRKLKKGYFGIQSKAFEDNTELLKYFDKVENVRL